MSRRTPIKELIAEEVGTPSSPIRRSTRIATRRPSQADDDTPHTKPKKILASQDVDESDRVSVSSASSSTSTRILRTRTASQSPLTLLGDETKATPGRRTRRTGSASSLVDEEIAAISRSSPVPGRLTRRSLARSMSCSPISELASKNSQNGTSENAIPQVGAIKKGRRLSVSEPIGLESIKEVEGSPKQKTSLDDPKDEDLPFKKKKAVHLHTIAEKSFSDDVVINDLTENKQTKNDITEGISSDEQKITPVKTVKGKYSLTLLKPTANLNVSNEEKELIVVLDHVSKASENSLNMSKDNQTNSLEDEPHLNLHISDSDDNGKTDKILNISGGSSNTSEKENLVALEDSKLKSSPKKNRLSESNCNTVINSHGKEAILCENSFYEPMDVDITLDTVSPAKKTPQKTPNSIKKMVEADGEGGHKIPMVDLVRMNLEKSPSEKIIKTTSVDSVEASDTDKSVNPLNNSLDEQKNKSIDSTETTISSSMQPKNSTTDTSADTNNSAQKEPPATDDKVNLVSLSSIPLEIIVSEAELTKHSVPSDISSSVDHLKDPETQSPKSAKSTGSPDQLNKVSSTEQINETIIVATAVTPLRTSPRQKKTPVATDACDNLLASLSPVATSSDKLSVNNITSPSCKINTSNADVNNSSKGDVDCDISNDHTEDDVDKETATSDELPVNKSASCEINASSADVVNNTNKEDADCDISKDRTEDDGVDKEIAASSDELPVNKSNSASCEISASNTDVVNNISNEDADCDISKDHTEDDDADKETPPETEKPTVPNSGNENQLDFSTTDMELNSSLKGQIIQLSKDLESDSSDFESVTHFIDDCAEEGEEDTPSDGSNDIIDIGESVGSDVSQIDTDESYEPDSFIDDDSDGGELLSGDEYDLGQEKPTVKQQKKKKRIIEISDSSDEEHKNDADDVVVVENTDNLRNGVDSDMETMSTRPYCGLTPPSVVSVRESLSDGEDKLSANNKDEEDSVVSTLINKEDNLESLEHIKEHSRTSAAFEKPVIATTKSPEKTETDLPLVKCKTPDVDRQTTSVTPNNSLLDVDSSQTSAGRQRKRLSSLSIQENFSLEDLSDGSLTNRIQKVVEAFCANISKSDVSTGNISLNYSLGLSTSQQDIVNENNKEEVSVLEVSNRRRSKSECNSGTAGRRFSIQKNEIQNSTPISQKSGTDAFSPQKDTTKKRISLTKSTAGDVRTAKDDFARQEKTTSNLQIHPTNAVPKQKSKKKLSKQKTKKEIVKASDSEMSDDLDKELTEKYSDTASDENVFEPVETEPRKLNLRNLRAKKIKSTENTKIEKIEKSEPVLQTKERKPKGIKRSTPSDDLIVAKKIKSTIKVAAEDTKVKARDDVTQNVDWKIDNLPQNLENALSKHKSKPVVIRKVEKQKKPLRKPKLLPGTNNAKRSWISSEDELLIKPSTCCVPLKETKKIKTEKIHDKDFRNRMASDSNRLKHMSLNQLLKKK